MSDRPTVTEVVAKLNTYGSADQLAAFFEQEGVTGFRNRHATCPVARYITLQSGHEWVSVAPDQVSAPTVKGGPLSESVPLDPDGIVHQFVIGFDAGDYPALVVHAC